MANVKTALVLEKSVYQKAERIARRKKMRRGRLFAEAVKEYVKREDEKTKRRRGTKELVDSLNAAYADGPDEEKRLALWIR